jgi:hypothetical protein
MKWRAHFLFSKEEEFTPLIENSHFAGKENILKAWKWSQ